MKRNGEETPAIITVRHAESVFSPPRMYYAENGCVKINFQTKGTYELKFFESDKYVIEETGGFTGEYDDPNRNAQHLEDYLYSNNKFLFEQQISIDKDFYQDCRSIVVDK